MSLFPSKKKFINSSLADQYTYIGVWSAFLFYFFPNKIGATLHTYFFVFLVVSSIAFFIYRYYLNELRILDNRKKYLKKIKHEIWDYKYIKTLQQLIDKLEFIDKRSSYIFSLISITYTFVIFLISWVLGSNGKLISIEVLPEMSTYIERAAIAFSLVFLFIVIYKIVIKYHYFDKTRYSLLLAIIVSVFWWAFSDSIIVSALWFVLIYFSPVLSIFSVLFILASNKLEIDALKPLVLLIMVSNFIYTLLSYMKSEKKDLWSILTIDSLHDGLYMFIIIILHIINSIVILFFAEILQIFSFLSISSELVMLIFANLVSGLILKIFYDQIVRVINIVFVVLGLTLPAIIIIFGVFFSLKSIFFSESGCFLVDVKVLGFFALIVIIPITNSVFDFLSYFVSKNLIIHLSEIKPKETKWFLTIIFSHIFVDIIIAVLLLLGLASGLLFIIKYYLIYMTSKSCGLVDLTAFANLVKNSPATLDTAWVMIMLFTTLVPTLIHTTASVLSLIRNIVPRDARCRAIRFFRSNKLEPSELAFTSALFSFTFIGAFLIVSVTVYFLVSLLMFLFKYLLIDIYHLSILVL